ncbi:MAG: hypothetical protein JNK40_14105 [Chromatiales bacterium]|nr:hypothetical protein [Chromatiales bacterium]
MSYIIGIATAALVALLGSVAGFDRERGFYPAILMVVASYYVLFAAIGDSANSLWPEAMVMAAFVVTAVLGFRRNLWLVVVGLAAHGILDLFHASGTVTPGVPAWWPAFCLAFDISAAAYCAYLLLWRAGKAGSPDRRCRRTADCEAPQHGAPAGLHP